MTNASDAQGVIPIPYPKGSYSGAIRRRGLRLSYTYPFGHLEFNEERIRLWGPAMNLDMQRPGVEAVRLSSGGLRCRVSVIAEGGRESDFYLTPQVPRPFIRYRLRKFGWPIVEDHSLFLKGKEP